MICQFKYRQINGWKYDFIEKLLANETTDFRKALNLIFTIKMGEKSR